MNVPGPGGTFRELPPPVVTALYVPGDRPERFDKAVAAGPDVVVIDLEDAVAMDRKARARAAAADFLASRRSLGPSVQVRINASDTPWWADDLAALAGSPGLSGLRLPKVRSAADVATTRRRAPGVPLHPLIETASGVEALSEIAAADVSSVGIGEADLASDLGITDDRALDWIRTRLIVAARAADLPAPMMSVFTALYDDEALDRSCRTGHARGFFGRSAIHPRQLPVIRAAFTPDRSEVDHAHAVVDAMTAARSGGLGVAVLPGGRMIDAAMVRGAERTLALASLLSEQT